MYALRCRACVARRVPHRVSVARSYSVTPSPEESVDTKQPSSARITNSWDGIKIPSRQEIQLRKMAYKPDLSYLASGGSSLASRLAANISSSPQSSAEEPSNNSETKPVRKFQTEHIPVKEIDPERDIRIQAITAARKAEREARQRATEIAQKAVKAAQDAARAARESERAAKAAAAQRSTERAALLTDQRRAERLRREATLSPRQRLAIDSSLTEARPELRPRRGPPIRGPPKTAQRTSKPSRPRKPSFRIQTMPSQDAALGNSSDDITWEIVEAGGDEKDPAEFTTPDVPFTDLDILFSPSFEQRVENTIRSPVTSFSRGQIQTFREAYGGDYQRLASQTRGDSVTPPHKLGPLKHAGIVLSHRSDVSIGARNNALAVISTAVSGATGAKMTQAIVD